MLSLREILQEKGLAAFSHFGHEWVNKSYRVVGIGGLQKYSIDYRVPEKYLYIIALKYPYQYHNQYKYS